MRVGPAAEAQLGLHLADRLAQLPRVPDTARRAERLVAAQDDQSLSRADGPVPRRRQKSRVCWSCGRDDTRRVEVMAKVGEEMRTVFPCAPPAAVSQAEKVSRRVRARRRDTSIPRTHAGVGVDSARGTSSAATTLRCRPRRRCNAEEAAHARRVVKRVGAQYAYLVAAAVESPRRRHGSSLVTTWATSNLKSAQHSAIGLRLGAAAVLVEGEAAAARVLKEVCPWPCRAGPCAQFGRRDEPLS